MTVLERTVSTNSIPSSNQGQILVSQWNGTTRNRRTDKAVHPKWRPGQKLIQRNMNFWIWNVILWLWCMSNGVTCVTCEKYFRTLHFSGHSSKSSGNRGYLWFRVYKMGQLIVLQESNSVFWLLYSCPHGKVCGLPFRWSMGECFKFSSG